MGDKNKTKIQLIKELEEMKKRIVELETGESSCRHAVKEFKPDDGRLEQYLDLVDVLVAAIEEDHHHRGVVILLTTGFIPVKNCKVADGKGASVIKRFL